MRDYDCAKPEGYADGGVKEWAREATAVNPQTRNFQRVELEPPRPRCNPDFEVDFDFWGR